MSKNVYLAIISSVLCCAMPLGFSLPSHPEICSGTAEIERIDSHTMQITPSHQAILHYQDFQIGVQEKVRFVQNSSKSCVLNRITGENPSQVLGSLESNGKVFLVNPNGIYFGADSKVNVGSLIASTLDIADEDFLQETYRFSLSQENNSSIVNEGLLHSAEGSIVLLAPSIHNLGHIQAQAGSVLLASGEHVTLDFTGDGLIQFSVEGSLKEALIEHLGKIEGSIVSMKLPVAKRAITEILNMDGADEAEIFIEENGVIKFAASSQIKAHKVSAEGSQISVLGSVDASSALDKGGEVHLFGKDIFLEGAKIDASGLIGAGEVLIGGEFQGKGKTPYASRVLMDEFSKIYADALETGKGGLVVLWSQDKTLFNGKIFAKGGSLGGDGGLVETSSTHFLEVNKGKVDTRSTHGNVGKWLLDPDYVYISNTSTSCTSSGGSYGGCSSGSCNISTSIFNNAASNITITANTTIYIQDSFALTTESGVSPPVSLSISVCNRSTYTPGCVVQLGPINITTDGGSVAFSTLTQILTPLSIDTTNGGAAAGGDILTGSLYSGSFQPLTLTAGTGTVYLGTAYQGTDNNVGSITVNSAGLIEIADLLGIKGNLTLTNIPCVLNSGSSTSIDTTSGGTYAGGTISMGALTTNASSGTVTIAAGSSSITISGPIGSSAAPISGVTVRTTNTFSFPGEIYAGSGGITLPSLLDVSTALYLSAPGGTITFGATSIGTPTALPSFTLASGTVASWPTITTTGNILITPAVTINNTPTFTSSGGTVQFSDSISGTGNLTLNGAASFPSASTLSLSNFTLSSGSITTWPTSMTATGALTFTPAVSINSEGTPSLTSNVIMFANTLDGPGGVALNGGMITLAGAVGGSSNLSSFTLNSGTIANWPNISTIGNIFLSPAIAINSSPMFTSSGGVIAFANDLDGPGSLTLNGNSGSVTFSGAVGSNTALSSLVINSGSSVTFSNTLNGATAVTIGGITNGVTFTGAVGANTALSSLVINSGSSTTFASNVSAGTISITPTAIFTGTCNVTGSTSIAFGNAINGPGSLTLTGGAISINGAVGSSPALTSFTLASGSVTNTPSSMTTTNALTLTPSVTLSGPLSLNSTNGPITTSAIDGSSIGGQSLTINAGAGSFSVGDLGTGTALGQVQLTSTLSSFIESIITSAQSITVNASISQIQNNLFPITFLTDNSRIDSANGGASSGASISLGPIAANSTGTGAQTLTINATSSGGATALITLYGELGGDDQPLGSLTIEGTPSSSIPEVYIAGSISTSSIVGGAGGAITIDPQITLTGSSTMSTISANSSGAPIVLNDLYANNLQSLSLFSGSGFISTGDLGSSSYPLSSISLTGDAITLNGPVYASGSIGSMSIINSGALTIQSGAITLSGSFTQQGNGAVTLGSNITANGGILSLQSIVSLTQPITLISSSDLTLSSQVTSSVSSGLTLSSTGGAIYAAQLGTTGSPLGAVTFSANGLSSLAGIVTNNGAIDIRAPILLTSQPTVLDTTAGTSSGTVRFQDTVDATNTGSLAEALQIVTEGSSVTFDAALGGNAPLGGLDISSMGSVTIGGSIFTTSSSTSSLAGSIQINGPVTLSGDSLATIEIDTTEGGGAEIFFAESISGEPSLILDASSSSITFGADVEGLESLTVESAGTVAIQNISVEEGILIPQSITLSLDTSIQSQTGDIVLGSIDGAFDLTVVTDDGKITLGVLGGVTPLDQVTVESAAQVSIQNMTTSGAITLTIPIILLDSTTLNTTAASALGAAITLGSVNASTVGGQSLTINAGTSEVVLQGDIGTIISPGDLDVTAGALYLENASIFTNGMQQYHSPVLVAQDIVFRSKGNITFDEMVDPVSTPSNLSLYPGGGTLTFASSVGDAPFGKVGVFNAGSFVSHDIFASSLVVAGGMPSIYLEGNIFLSGEGGIRLDGRSIFFGGSIEAPFLFFRTRNGNIANLGAPVPITNTGNSFLDLNYFDAIHGVVGSEQSPIEINSDRLLIVGADPSADFIGNPFHDIVHLVHFNAPCLVTFNDVIIYNCDPQPLPIREIFNSIAKDLFYVPGLYSSWDNLSNLEYFQQEPVNLGENPRDRKLFYLVGDSSSKNRKEEFVFEPLALKSFLVPVERMIENPVLESSLDRLLPAELLKTFATREELVPVLNSPAFSLPENIFIPVEPLENLADLEKIAPMLASIAQEENIETVKQILSNVDFLKDLIEEDLSFRGKVFVPFSMSSIVEPKGRQGPELESISLKYWIDLLQKMPFLELMEIQSVDE